MSLVKVIQDIRDDIIKIIEGGHIELQNDEEMENGFGDRKANLVTSSVTNWLFWSPKWDLGTKEHFGHQNLARGRVLVTKTDFGSPIW